MKFLLAVDGSEYSKKMVDYITQHKHVFASDNEYTLLTVDNPLPSRMASALSKEAVAEFHKENTDEVLTPLLKLLAEQGYKVSPQAAIGSPGETISRIAHEGAYDMVVIGSKGQGALANLVMGSVGVQVLANCQVPVLMVR